MTKPIQVKNIMIGEGIPKICVPLTGKEKERILEEGKAAADAGADLARWGADFFEGLSDQEETEEVLNALSDILGQIPLIFTIRTKKEGGKIQISTESYVNLLLGAAKTEKADFIDVEIFGDEEEKVKLIRSLHQEKALVIGSSHDFQNTAFAGTVSNHGQNRRRHPENGSDAKRICRCGGHYAGNQRYGGEFHRETADFHGHGRRRIDKPYCRRKLRFLCDLRHCRGGFCTGTASPQRTEKDDECSSCKE